MNWSSFIAGLAIGVSVSGVLYQIALRRLRRADADFRTKQRARIDELSDWSRRNFDQARKELGLPPRVQS